MRAKIHTMPNTVYSYNLVSLLHYIYAGIGNARNASNKEWQFSKPVQIECPGKLIGICGKYCLSIVIIV